MSTLSSSLRSSKVFIAIAAEELHSTLSCLLESERITRDRKRWASRRLRRDYPDFTVEEISDMLDHLIQEFGHL